MVIPARETEARRAHIHQPGAQTPTFPSTWICRLKATLQHCPRRSLGTPPAMFCDSHFVDKETGPKKKRDLLGSPRGRMES